MIRTTAILIATLLFAVAVIPASSLEADDAGWRPLFNGMNLEGWDTWLGRPHASVEGVDIKRNEQGYVDPVGLNKDPKRVYTVEMVDGAPAIRISGEIFGALTSKEEFENYQVRLEFKWGEKKWPPRDKAVRDSGLLYHCVGPHGAAGTFWMRSQECQIQEHDCGDYWSVAGAMVDVQGERKEGKGPVRFKRGGSLFTVPGKEYGPRIVKAFENEKPGEWNVIEVLCLGGTSVHVVNGKANMVLTNSRHMQDGKEVPLTRGRIQIQSEGAEVFYRNIAVRPIRSIPEEYLR
jgi:hypothetical protein